MKQSGGLSEVRRRNRAHIREAIYKRAPVTRTEIAEELGLTLPTVTTSVADMLEEKLLLEEPLPDAAYLNGPGGRRPLLLRFNPDWGSAIGVELGPYDTGVLLTDLTGAPLKEALFPSAPEGYAETLDFLCEILRPFIAAAPRLLGIGVGIPGFIGSDTGIIRASSIRRNWNGKALAEDLSMRLSVPVRIDNNVRMRARGQALFHGNGLPDLFAYLFVSKGIACPLMVGGKVLSGSTYGAGELGHMVMQPDGPICPTCGRRGCLEALAGETAILRDCVNEMNFDRAPFLREITEGKTPSVNDILQAQQAGDPGVTAVMERALGFLGTAVANVVNLLSPAEVLVNGYIFRTEENRKLLLLKAQEHLYGLNAQEVQIHFLPFDRYSGAKGAAAAVIEDFCLHESE